MRRGCTVDIADSTPNILVASSEFLDQAIKIATLAAMNHQWAMRY
jgi:hypothetical protein